MNTSEYQNPPSKYSTSTQTPQLPKVARIVPKYSVVCENSLEVVLFGTDNGVFGKYIFKNNEFLKAPDCVCQSCLRADDINLFTDSVEVQGLRATDKLHRGIDGQRLMCIGISWIGCKQSGVMDTFVNIHGIIGKYRKTPEGLILKDENKAIALLPNFPIQNTQAIMEKDLLLLNTKICPHVSQKIYFCKTTKSESVHQVVLNKLTLHFEIIKCSVCTYDKNLELEYYDKKTKLYAETVRCETTEKFAIVRSAKNENIFLSTYCPKTLDLKLQSPVAMEERKLTNSESNNWYNTSKSCEENILEKMCPANENHQTLVATEGATFGTIYWMMNENYKIDPFKIAPTIPGTGTFLTILSSLDVFKSRKVIASKFTLFENVTPKDLIDHRCEDCENNVRPTDAWLESDKGKPTLRNQMHPDYHPTYKKNSEYEDAQEDFDDIELKVFQKLCNMEDNLFKQIIDFEKPKEQFTAPPHPQMTHRVAQPHYVPVEYFNHTISDLLRQISGLQHEQAMQNGQMQHMANEIRSIGNAVCSLHSSQLQQPPNSAASMFPYPIHPMPSTFPQQAPHAPNAPQMTANSMQSIAELILAQRGIAPRRERRLTEGPKKYNRVIPPSPRIPSSTDKKEMLKKSNDRFDKLREEVSDVRTQLSGLEDTTFKKPKKLHFLEPDEESESDENGNDVDEFSEADDDDEDVDREMKVLVESLKNRVQ